MQEKDTPVHAQTNTHIHRKRALMTNSSNFGRHHLGDTGKDPGQFRYEVETTVPSHLTHIPEEDLSYNYNIHMPISLPDPTKFFVLLLLIKTIF